MRMQLPLAAQQEPPIPDSPAVSSSAHNSTDAVEKVR